MLTFLVIPMDEDGQVPKTGWFDPAKQEVIVRVLNTDMRGWILTVPPGTSVIGREPDCQLHLPHYTISRRHCSLQVEADHIAVRDLNSMNGTMVNGAPSIDAELRPGDNLRVGEVELGIDIRERRPSNPQAPLAETASPATAQTPPPALPAEPATQVIAQETPQPPPVVAQSDASSEQPAPPLEPSQYSYHLPTPSWAVRPHVETVRYREAKRTIRFDPSRRDAFKQFHSK